MKTKQSVIQLKVLSAQLSFINWFCCKFTIPLTSLGTGAARTFAFTPAPRDGSRWASSCLFTCSVAVETQTPNICMLLSYYLSYAKIINLWWRLNIDTKCAQWNSFHSVKVILNIEVFVCVTTVHKVLRDLAACICRCARRARGGFGSGPRAVCSWSLRARRPLSAAGVSGSPHGGCSRWNMARCRAHLPTRCNCGASGAACAELILLLRYIWVFIIWLTVVNKIIVFLK